MPRPKAKKRTSANDASSARELPRNDAGLMDLALGLEDFAGEGHGVDSFTPAELVVLGAGSGAEAIDPEHVFGFALAGEAEAADDFVDGVEFAAVLGEDLEPIATAPDSSTVPDSSTAPSPPEAPVASAAPAAAPAGPPASADFAGALVAEMQNRFADLQRWADQTTAELNARRAQIDELEADLRDRQAAMQAEEEKTAHDRERFARYRSAEQQKLVERAAQAEAEAEEILQHAEDDARILRETATAESIEEAQALQREARATLAREQEQAAAEHGARCAELEAEIARDRERVQAEAATVERERKRLAEATAEVGTLREELDAEWQSVLRLQRSAESLVKAWEAESARRRSSSTLRLAAGDVTLLSGPNQDERTDGGSDSVRLAA